MEIMIWVGDRVGEWASEAVDKGYLPLFSFTSIFIFRSTINLISVIYF